MTVDHSPYLEPTEFLDWQQDSVRDFVSSAIRGACGDTEKAIAIFTAVCAMRTMPRAAQWRARCSASTSMRLS